MSENKYMVLDNGIAIARYMTLETALMLVCSVAEKYWREPNFEVTIRREGAEPKGDTDEEPMHNV